MSLALCSARSGHSPCPHCWPPHAWSHVFLLPRRPGLAVAPTRAAESSPPATPTSPSSGAASGKALIPDDEFTLSKYAELKPVPCITYADAFALREKCATPILKQVRNDVTCYRYGDEQHLYEALKRIFQFGWWNSKT